MLGDIILVAFIYTVTIIVGCFGFAMGGLLGAFIASVLTLGVINAVIY